jgi:hypothetical protein
MDYTPNEQSISYQEAPFYYSNQLQISNDATTPNTQLDIGVGTILDSTATFQLTNSAPIVIDATFNGLNGLDTGALAANTMYCIYLVADPVNLRKTGAMISLSYITPLLPFHYSAYSLIGYIATDASSHFLKGYWTVGNGSSHLFMYDAPQASPITAGAATSATAVVLTTLVPAVNNLPTWLAIDATPAAASRTLSLRPGNATGIAAKVTSQVTSVHVTANVLVLSQLVTGVPTINYLWSAGGGDAVAINVAGYEYFI